MTPRHPLYSLGASALAIMALAAAVSASLPPDFDALSPWRGDWTGRLTVQRGDRVLQEVDMSLRIHPLDSAGCYTWALFYDTGATQDERPYVICPTDSLGEHFRIDERNGIILEADRFGHVLYSRFEVMDNLLLTRDEVRGDTLYHEIVSGRLSPKPTGDTVLASGDTIPAVAVYPLATRQSARMTRGR